MLMVAKLSNHEPRIIISVENENASRVTPDFILNRIDLWEGFSECRSETLHIRSGSDDYYVQAVYEADRAELGLYLSRIPKRELKSAVRYIFASHPEVMTIGIRCCFAKFASSLKTNYFRIELPDSVEGLHERMSRKFKYNLKRERRTLEESEGPVIFEEYRAGNFPSDLFAEFARMKRATHTSRYVPEGRGYFDDTRLISNAYVMRNSRNGEIISMVLSCEQGSISYIDNLTYNVKYSGYSPGKIIYHHYIETMINKGRHELFLGAGGPDYKRHYGSIEQTVYNTIIHRQFYKHAAYCVRLKLTDAKRLVKAWVHNIIHGR